MVVDPPEELTIVTLPPVLAAGERPLDVAFKLLDKTGNTVLGAGNVPLPPLNVGPPVAAYCADGGEGPSDAGSGAATEVAELAPPLLLPAVLPELLLAPLLPPLAVTADPEGMDEAPPPAHPAAVSAAAIPVA